MNAHRKWFFRLLAPLLVLLAVGGVELGLRVASWPPPGDAPTTPEGYGADYLVVAHGQRQDLLERYTDDQGRQMVRTSRQMVESRFMHDLAFTEEPAPGVKRIFCLGGSATFGVPHEATPEIPFPGRLAHYLTEAGVNNEVFNLGGASFGSDQVLDLAAQLMDLGAAAIVVYSANNEFFNYQLNLLERNRGWDYQEVAGLRLVLALRELLGLEDPNEVHISSEEPGEAAEQRQRALVADVMRDTFDRHGAAARPIRREGRLERKDPHYLNVVTRYEANLKKILELAGEAEPSPLVVLCEVPANLLHKPWLSLNSPGVDVEAHHALVRRGEMLLRVKDEADVAVKTLDRAIEMDPLYAEAHYQLARAYLAMGKASRAVLPLHDALEMDMVQGRPVAALGRVVRELSAGGEALWVNMEPIFKQEKDPRRGQGFFHDSCHLTERGYDELGKAVARALLPKLEK